MSNEIAILGDLHFGVRHNSPHFREFIVEYVNGVIDECIKYGIKTIAQVGDLCNSRLSLNHLDHDAILNLYQRCDDVGIEWIQLVGNHDSTFKRHLRSNTPSKLARGFKNICVIDKPIECVFGGENTLLLPWICDENYKQTMEMIKNTDAKYCLAHLELDGYPVNGQIMRSTMKDTIFKKFDRVITGHYHSPSSRGNIDYIGSLFDLTWADVGDVRGWYTLSPTINKLTLIKNEASQSLFKVFEYTGQDLKKLDVGWLGGSIVKVLIQQKISPQKLKTLKQMISDTHPIDAKYIDNTLVELTEVEFVDEVELQTDTKKIIVDYVSDQEDVVETKKESVSALLCIIIDKIRSEEK